MSAFRPRVLAGLALLSTAGVLALVDRGTAAVDAADASSVVRGEASAVPAWAHAVEAGDDHLPAAELARRLLDAPDSVLLVDVRPSEEFAAFHLVGSRNLDLPRLLGPEGAALLDAHPTRLVVLVSNGMTHPAQAWVELARRGRTNVRVLEEGLDGFRAAYLTPPSLRGPTTQRRASEDARLFRALSERVLERRATPPPAAGQKEGP